ncbi:MAG: GNAT family N-acetyltransferase [Herpetosiphonaceae bacterium]|nr:GNAT family N-acetyltransferase [Herpetosiphonaceae bacterium]
MDTLTSSSYGIISTYWAQFFGLGQAALAKAGRLVVPHAGLDDYPGMWFFRRGALLIISVPPVLLEHYRAADDCSWADPLAGLHAPPLRQIGPAWIGYTDRSTLRSLVHNEARRLTEDDQPAWHVFQAACDQQEWEHGGSDWAPERLVGCFRNGRLVALAGYEIWGGAIAHIAVVTHPLERGRGYGRQVVERLASAALERGLIAQYRTLSANAASLQIGWELGFVTYAETIAVRFADATA